MPMGPAELTLVKLNSVLGGKGGEWGSEEGPQGAALAAEVRSRARQLGNAGDTAGAAELLLKAAAQARAPIPANLLAEVEQNILPGAANPQGLATAIATLRTVPAAAGAQGGKPSFFKRLFGR
jgi:hypothetical protein